MIDELPDIPDDERAGIEDVVSRLEANRPVPSPAFRGELRRRLVAAPSPRRVRSLRLRAATYLVAGAAMLAVAALGSFASAGPLAPDGGTPVTASR